MIEFNNKLQYKKVNPPFKYIGGKTWLKDKLRAKVKHQVSKNKFTAFCEPFCGGLGAFLNVYDILPVLATKYSHPVIETSQLAISVEKL